MKVQKPWGNYETLHLERRFQVKRIEVAPGQRLSYQRHKLRAEKWVVVEGEGVVVLNEKDIPVVPGSVVAIPVMSRHRMQNAGVAPLVFVEVQIGDYFGEDDIERLQDDYSRSSASPAA